MTPIKDQDFQFYVDRLGFGKVESLNSESAIILFEYMPQKDLANAIYNRDLQEEFPRVSFKPSRDSYGRILIYAVDSADRGDAAEALHELNKIIFRK